MNENQGPGTIGLSIADLTATEERRLRTRLERWYRARFMRDVAWDFDDVWQEACCKLIAAERKGRVTRNAEAALRWALSLCLLDEQRSRARRATVPLEHAPRDALATAAVDEPDCRAEQRECARYLFENVGHLPRRQWQILLLGGLGLEPDEIQRRLHISRRTYYRHRAAALRALTAQLGELLDDRPGVRHDERRLNPRRPPDPT